VIASIASLSELNRYRSSQPVLYLLRPEIESRLISNETTQDISVLGQERSVKIRKEALAEGKIRIKLVKHTASVSNVLNQEFDRLLKKGMPAKVTIVIDRGTRRTSRRLKEVIAYLQQLKSISSYARIEFVIYVEYTGKYYDVDGEILNYHPAVAVCSVARPTITSATRIARKKSIRTSIDTATVKKPDISEEKSSGILTRFIRIVYAFAKKVSAGLHHKLFNELAHNLDGSLNWWGRLVVRTANHTSLLTRLRMLSGKLAFTSDDNLGYTFHTATIAIFLIMLAVFYAYTIPILFTSGSLLKALFVLVPMLLIPLYWPIAIYRIFLNFISIFFYNPDAQKEAHTISDSELPFVSVLIPMRNEPADMVITLLESVLGQDYPSYEIIVIDNSDLVITDGNGQERINQDFIDIYRFIADHKGRITLLRRDKGERAGTVKGIPEELKGYRITGDRKGNKA
jgi:hypothetical protein